MKLKKSVALIAILLLSTTSLASGTLRSIEVEPGPSLIVNDFPFVPKDANGNVVETFVYNGTTYVPIRAVAERFGNDVSYDERTNTAHISTPYDDTGEIFSLWYMAEQCLDLTCDIIDEAYSIQRYNFYLLDGSYESSLAYHSSYVNMVSDRVKYIKERIQSQKELHEELKQDYESYNSGSQNITAAFELLEKQIFCLERMESYYKDSGKGYTYAEAAKTTLSNEIDKIGEYYSDTLDYVNDVRKRYIGLLSDWILTF